MMINPIDMKKIVKYSAPKLKKSFYDEEETRFDVPFHGIYDSFLYISKFWINKWYTPAQYHDHFELCYVCEGNGFFVLENVQFQVSKGDIFVTKPGEIHCGWAAANYEFIVYAIGFRFDELVEIENDYYKLGLQRVCNDEIGIIKPYFDQIMEEINHSRPYAHLKAKSCLYAILIEIIRLYHSQNQKTSEETEPVRSEIIKVLNLVHSQNNYMNDIDEIARKVNMSRATLDREFKKQFGTQLGKYIKEVWIWRAKLLLKQPEESITNIVEKLNFPSVQAFCMFFKRHEGISPQKYRKVTNYGREISSDRYQSIK